MGLSHAQIHYQGRGQIEIHHHQLLPLDHDEEKDIKVQINEYHKLLEDLKTEKISLHDEFISELLIEKLSESWTDYKQQLKHWHKHMSLSDLITHIIIEDTNKKESATTRYAKANMVQDKPFHKRYANKIDHNNKNKYKYNNQHATPSNPISRAPASNHSFKKKGSMFCLWEAKTFCSSVHVQSCEK